MSKSKKSYKFVGVIIGVLLCVMCIPVIIFNLLFIFQGILSPDKAPSLLGKTPLIVLSESMNPTIQGGDLIISDSENPQNISKDDIISFFDPAEVNSSAIITHRVVEVTNNNSSVEFITKGDFNNAIDMSSVPASKFVGKYNGFRIAGLGNFCLWLKSLPGILICVGIPLLLLIGYDIYRRKNNIKNHEKVEDELREEIERLKKEKR